LLSLSLVIFLPLVGAIIIAVGAFISKGLDASIIKWVALVVALATFLASLWLYTQFKDEFDESTHGMQLIQEKDWVKELGISYHVGVDGISLWLILLTTFMTPLCVLAAWNSIEKGVSGFMISLLALETSMIGVFCALDLFLFFVFWEAMLIPMYFLIGIWGGQQRIYATIKFVLYTMVGSALMLVGILYLYQQNGNSFNLLTLYDADLEHQKLLFLAFFIAFAIKVPLFPFHTWLPDAHVEAPTAISVILAGILLKMGTYGLVRVNMSMFPQGLDFFCNGIGFWGNSLALLGFINIVYGSFCALAQTDFKKLVAYSSIGHMGFVILGLSARNDSGITGAILQMFNHGVISAMLFLLVGVLYDRAHHREINGFGGLGTKMPVYTGITTLAFMASLGLPGLSGFVGEALSLLGAYDKFKMLTILSTIGIVIGAAYFLWTLQRVFLGTLNPKYEEIPEINGREILTLVPLGILTIVLGVWPNFAIDMFRESVTNLIDVLQAI
jgi:NADH-quinone oxidoreductase subunit M